MEWLIEGLYRICIPFENLYTTVFVFVCKGGCLVYDSGACSEDVTTYILPALQEKGLVATHLVCSHWHNDHAGGLDALHAAFPQATVVRFGKRATAVDGDVLCGRYRVFNLGGHTDDGLAVFDAQTRALVCGDCLQVCGIDRYGTAITDAGAYRETLRRVRALSPTHLFASHDYVPTGFRADGVEVATYSDACEQALERIEELIRQNPTLSDEELSNLYNQAFPLPPIGAGIIEALKIALSN